jgi:glycosyl transferase family 25
MSAQADRLSIVLERFSAIDYRSPVYAEEVHMASLSSGQMPGQVACTFSHRRCWELLLASGESQLAIFEDDAMLDDAIVPILASRLPNVIDLLKLETTGERVILDRRVAGRIGPVELRRIYAKHMGSCGYIVTRRAAEALIAETEIIDACTTDALIFPHGGVMAGIPVFQLYPAACIQERRHENAVGFERLTDSGVAPAKPTLGEKLVREALRPIRRVKKALTNWKLGRMVVRVPFGSAEKMRRRQLTA